MAPKIAFIVEGRYLRQEMPRAVIRELEARGLEPDVLCPHGAQFDPQSGVEADPSPGRPVGCALAGAARSGPAVPAERRIRSKVLRVRRPCLRHAQAVAVQR